MTELQLVDTETGEVEARLVLAADGTVTVTGPFAGTGRSIIASYARLNDTDEAGAFEYLRAYSWANGPLALTQQEER